jgi:hypothetical protein
MVPWILLAEISLKALAIFGSAAYFAGPWPCEIGAKINAITRDAPRIRGVIKGLVVI